MNERIQLNTGCLELNQSSGKRREYAVRFIRAGRLRAQGNRPSNIEIPPEPLQAAVEAGLFAARASFLDHAGWLEYPSLRDLVGVTLEAEWNQEQQAVEGVVRLYDSPAAEALAAVLDDMLQDADAGQPTPDVGLSLVFWPRWAPRDNPEDPLRLAEIKHIESCDFVFEPAAEGRVTRGRTGYRQSQALPGAGSPLDPGERALALDNRDPALNGRTGGVTMDEDNQIEQTPSAGAWLSTLSATVANTMLANSGLPAPSRERLLGQVEAEPERFNSPEAVQAAIQDERAYLARLQEDNVVQLSGPAPRAAHISLGRSGLEQVSLALEALVAGEQPASGIQPLSGIREAYMLLSGDYEMTGLFHADRVYLANVSSATMPGLVANALNKRVANLFQQYPRWWEKIVHLEDFTTLQQVKWITLGGVGELPTVAEGASYTELTWADQTESVDFIKKGGYLGITLEAMDKDDTRKLQAAPRALAQAAWLTLAKSVAGIFTQSGGVGPTLSDARSLFHADHNNLDSAALSFTSYAAARTQMRKQTELSSQERLGALTAPRYLLTPPDLEIAALQILASEGQPGTPNNDANPLAEGASHDARMNAARERVLVVDLWGDSNDWAAVADPRLYPSIGLGFRYGRTPEVFSVASPTAGLMFTHDTLPVKVRFFFAVGPIDFRGLFKANVA